MKPLPPMRGTLDDRWTCQMKCVAILDMGNGRDFLHTFVNIDKDGSLTQIIEGNDFCKVGDTVHLGLVKIKG